MPETPDELAAAARAGDAPLPPGAAAAALPPATPPNAPRRGFFRRHWGKVTVASLIGVPLALFAIYTLVVLNWSYSTGQRAGYVQKISRKGYVCKTWEGTLYTDIARGFRSDSFSFTVRSDSMARLLETLGGKRVAVEYEQHIGLPSSCFGDTEYFVTGVRVIPE
ncbi:MAG: hypothetical protein RLZ32_242 [Gemmatimonadota bacterium]|jgi:hypothetical protein